MLTRRGEGHPPGCCSPAGNAIVLCAFVPRLRQHLYGVRMAKGYWVTVYRSISDPDKLAAYAKLAPPAIAPFGGRYLARGTAAVAYEAGLKERIVRSGERRVGEGGR